MVNKQDLKKAALNLLKYGIVLLIFFILIQRLVISWDELDTAELSVRVLPLIAALGCFVLFYTIVGYLSTRIINDCGGSLRPLTGIRLWTLSMLGKYLPGKVWLVVGKLYLAAEKGVHMRVTGIGLFYEILFMLAASVLVGGLCLPFIDTGIIPGMAALPIAAAGFVLMLVLLTRPRLVNRVLRLFMRKNKEKEKKDVPVIPPLCFRPRFILGYVARFAGAWLIWGLGFYLLTQSVLSLPIRTLPAIAGISVIAWFIGFVSLITPGGLGVREGVLTYFLKTFTEEPIAILIALLSRIVITVSEILLVLLLEGLYRFKRETGADEAEGLTS
jgi:uncharacterized membrane protein YbhN (UPF0104 family)